jgi:hypothetical protein
MEDWGDRREEMVVVRFEDGERVGGDLGSLDKIGLVGRDEGCSARLLFEKLGGFCIDEEDRAAQDLESGLETAVWKGKELCPGGSKSVEVNGDLLGESEGREVMVRVEYAFRGKGFSVPVTCACLSPSNPTCSLVTFIPS